MDKVGAIILAGGSGTRFKGLKQFQLIDNLPLWKFLYIKVNKYIDASNIIVVGVDIPGGDSRTKSVLNGLTFFKNSNILRIIIFESARPLISIKNIEIILKDNSESITFIKPLVNSITKISGDYVDRDDFRELLTPQAFNFSKLFDAFLSLKRFDYTDETRIYHEKYSIYPKTIEGDDTLFKVTYPKDLVILKALHEEFKKNA